MDAATDMILELFKEGYAGQEAIITEHAVKVRGCVHTVCGAAWLAGEG